VRSLATDSRWLPTTRRQISECPSTGSGRSCRSSIGIRRRRLYPVALRGKRWAISSPLAHIRGAEPRPLARRAAASSVTLNQFGAVALQTPPGSRSSPSRTFATHTARTSRKAGLIPSASSGRWDTPAPRSRWISTSTSSRPRVVACRSATASPPRSAGWWNLTNSDLSEGPGTRSGLRSPRNGLKRDGSDGTRTRDLRRDRPAF
jgi:hypothetical protein